MVRRLFVPAALLTIVACGTTVEKDPATEDLNAPAVVAAADSITAAALLQHIRNLADD